MPRRKTTLSDSSPPAPNQAEDTSSDSVRTSERPNKRRKTSVGSTSDNGSSEAKNVTDMDKKTRQTRSSGSSQPTSKKASILSRAATSSSPAPSSQPPTPQHLPPASQSQPPGQQQQPHHPQASASTDSTTTTDVLVYIRGQHRDQPLAAQLTLTQQRVDSSVLKAASDNKYQSEATPSTSQEQVVTSLSTEQQHHVHQQQTARFQPDEQRMQSSSAPPDLISEPKREARGGQIRDRRPTRSLEALFKVTDSELQNMREDPPTSTPSPAPVTITTDQAQSYIVLNDLHLMDSGEATQIIIAPSEITGDSMSDGGYYTISTVPSTSSHEQSAITFSSSHEGSREGGIKLVVHSDKGDYHELTNMTNQTHSYSLISDQVEKGPVGAGAKTPTSTPGRKRIHPQKPGKYKCKYCDRTCAKPSVLEKHLRAHTNERPFPCVVCGVSFKTKSNLSKHCKSNAHMSRTGISWAGSKDNSSTEAKDEDGKQDDEDNDSEGTDTDVEGAGYVDNDDESGDENPKVIVESTDGQLQIKPEPPMRQGSVLEGIRQKIDKNKRQQQEQEKEGKLEISKWFTRIFDAFDKPSESELAKYEEAKSVVQQNILSMDDMSGAEAILAELQRLKNELSFKYHSSLPVLMTHNFLPDNKMLVKILRPKLEYLSEASRSASQSSFKEQQTKNINDISCSGCVMSMSPKLGVPSILGRPPSSNSILQSKLAFKGSEVSDVGRDESRVRPQPMSQSGDFPAERLSYDSSTQRPKLLSHLSDNTVGSLRSLYSQSNRSTGLSSVSVEETPSLSLKQFSNDGGDTVKTTVSSSSRHPALGESNTAAFSTISSQSDKPVLVYQHALDSDSDKMLKFQGRSLSSSVTPDMLKDRIENIISSNAEIIDKHSVSEPPRPRNKYYRQTSDSSFQTLKISDLRPSSDTAMDRLSVEPNADKQWKKKLAASLSVGETDGMKLRPDFVKRSMSTSALKKAESSEGELRLLHPQTLMVTTNSLVPTASAPQFVSVGVVQQESAMLHQKLRISESPLVNKHSQEQLKDRVGSTPICQIVGKNLIVDGQVTTVTHISMINSGPIDSVNMNNVSPLAAAHMDGLSKAQLVCIPFPQLSKQSNVCDFKDSDVGTRKPSSPHGSFHKNQEAKSSITLTSEASKSFSVSSPSLSSGSPSGGRVTIQESQGNTKLIPGATLVHSAVPPSLPTKIVQGPGPREIQIQIQLSKNANHQPVAHIQQSGAGGTSATTTGVAKSSSESSSIISSMLQAPRQLSPMIGQPGVQFPTLSKAGSPLLTSRSFSGFTTGARVPVSSLVQTGSLDQDSLAAGKVKIGSTTYNLHDQKKTVFRQGQVTLSVPQQSKQPASFMTELQQRLAVPRSDSPTAVDWKKRDLAALVGVDSDKLAEHFKSQGLSDGLAAAAGAYLMSGPFTCDDCGEAFNQMGLLNQHKAQPCPKNKGLRRSLSAMETTADQNSEIKNAKPSSQSLHSGHSGSVLIKAGSQPLKKSNPALFKSLSTTDLHTEHQSNIKDLPKLREQLVLVSSSSPAPIITSLNSLSQNTEFMDISSSTNQQISQRQSLIIENNNPSLRRKKGRPKGSKNRPKDLNLVLAKARGAQCQTLLPGVRQGSIGQAGLDGSYQKDSPLPGLSGTGQVLFLQGGQFPKILLPRSAPTLATQVSTMSAEVAPTSTMAVGSQVMSTTSTTMSTISIGGPPMIGQPMVLPGGKVIRQNSNMGTVTTSTKANMITATSKPNIAQGMPILSLSPGVSISGLALNCTSSVSVLTPGTPITALTPGTPLGALTPGTSKSGGFMIFPVSTLTPATPGTPITPVTPTNPINCKTVRAQSLESTAFTTGPSKLATGSGLTLNISSAQSAGSSQFSQMSPRVIPYIPAVTFHNVDPTPKLSGSNLSISSPLPDPRNQQFKISQNPSMTLTLAGPSTPGTPLTPATPDTPTDLSGTRRKLKDKLLLRQSLSVERGHDKSSSMDSPHPGFLLKPLTDSPTVLPSPPPLLFFPSATKTSTPATTSVLLASLTKPIMSSLKLGSQPNAVITSAVMGKPKESEKPPDTFYRSESETHMSSETAKIHPPVMRAFSEPAAAKRLKKSKQMKPSPLSIEEKPPNGGLISKMLSSSRSGSHAGQDDPTSKKSWCLQTKVESGSDSFDSGLSLRSMSQETPFFFPKSGSVASLDSNELMIDLSGDNFNNVTIPINYSIPFVNVSRLQSGPLLTEWNHSSRLTGSQVNLSPLTLVGSKIILPAVGGTALLAREAKNWQLKRSISLHRHFQILSRLWQSSSPVTLDSMTAMALAQGNPSPALLGRMLLSYSSSGSFSETPSTGTPGSADPAKMKVPPSYLVSHESIDLTKDDPHRQLQISSSVSEHTDDQSLEIKSPAPLATPAHPDKSLHTSTTSQLKARLMASISSPIKNSLDSTSSEDHQHFHSRQASTPIKSAGLSFPSASSLLSSVEQHLSNMTPTGTLNTPMYGHSCPTLYTTTHVTFCCIQRPQPMYVAVKGSKKISMYSNWRLATHNPNPIGLTSRMLLSLYKSRNASNPVFAQCSMTPSNGGNQTHSSYWTYQRKKMGIVKKELLAPVKSEDTKASVKLELGSSSKEGKRQKLRLSKGGFKSNEKYEYIRGRGWGKYICELCGIRCKKPSMLKKHLRTHTDLRPYHCRHCHFSFKTKGNLTKHMKSKSHQKKCFELGIIPVPTSVDDSQIDSEALEEQCRISREARIHDSGDGQNPSGDEDDDDDMEGDDDEDDDEDDEDEGMSREDTEDQSFDQERSGSSSPRVLKRQSSVDEASPVFSFGQRSRPTWSQSKSRNREFSESSNISYSSQSSMENRAMSPHNIDTEIARSLLDLSQPRRSESKEIVDEEARRHALSHLQSLITQLMAQKKPLSGLNITGDGTSTAPDSGGLMMTSSLGPAGDGRLQKTPSTSDPQSQSQQWFSQDEGSLSRYSRKHETQYSPQRNIRSVSEDVLGPSGKSQTTVDRKMEELFVSTEDKGLKGTSTDKFVFNSRVNDPPGTISPTSTSAVLPPQSTSSPSMPARPNQLSLLKSPMSPSKLHHSNLPSPSLMSFLPAYVSSHYAQRARVSKTADQGPIIGQFVRKDSHSVNTPNVALTPNLVLAGQSQPFHFNIPFPGAGVGGFSDYDGQSMSPAVNTGKDFMLNIPIVTITDTSCESPTIESTADQCPNISEVKENVTELTGIVNNSAVIPEMTSTFTSSVSQTLTASSGDLNKTTSTMSSSALTSVSSLSSVKVSTIIKSSTKHTLESQGRSNSESATTSPKRRDSAIESLIRESAMPILLVTGTKYSNKSSSQASDHAHVSSPSPNSQSDSCIDSAGYPVAKRSRRLSSGKSRFLRRQRSLADDTAFPSAEQDLVFDSSKVSAELSPQKPADHSGDNNNRDTAGSRNLELVKSKSFQELSTIEEHVSQDGDGVAVGSDNQDGPGRQMDPKDAVFESVLDKTKDNLKPKLNSCVFCSENFDSVAAYNAHLKSRKHIGVLESLGMLPAGTYEKLQQSELHDSRAQDEEAQKVEVKVKVDEGHTGLDGSGGGGNVKMVNTGLSVSDDARISRSEGQSSEDGVCDGEESVCQEVPREEDVIHGPLVTVTRNEFGTLRRAVSLQEDPVGFTGYSSTPGQAKLQRPAYKRKISQQPPVTESATVLTKPHLNESLRQSLVKRAKYGLATVKEAEKGSKGQLVIDEECLGGKTLVTSAPPTSISQSLSTMVSLLTSAPLEMTLSGTVMSSVVSTSAASSSSGHGLTGGKTNSAEFGSDSYQPSAAMRNSGMDVLDIAQEYPTSHQGPLATGVPPSGLSVVSSVTAPQVSSVVNSGITIIGGQSTMSNLATSGTGYLVPSSVPMGSSLGHIVGSPLMSSAGVTVLGSSALLPATMNPGTGESSSSFSSKMVDGAMHYQCGLCDLNFTNMIQLKSHLVSHTELRPYVCQFCDAGFTNSQSLRIHLLTHGQDRPYICGNCGDTFAQLADLQVHYSSHSSTSIRQHPNAQTDIKTQTTIQSLTAQYGVPRQDHSSPVNQNFIPDPRLSATGINNSVRLELNTSPSPLSNSPSPISVVSYAGPAAASVCSNLPSQQESSLGMKNQPTRLSFPDRQSGYSPKLEIDEKSEGTGSLVQPKEDSLKQVSDVPEELVAKLENMCSSPASSGQLRVDLTDQSFSEDELVASDNSKGQTAYPQQWNQQQQPSCMQQPLLSSPSGYGLQHCYQPAQQQHLYIQQLQSQPQQLYPQDHQQQPFLQQQLQHQHFQMSPSTQLQNINNNNNNVGHNEQSCENVSISTSMLSGSLSTINAYSSMMDTQHCQPNWNQNLTNVSHTNLIQTATVHNNYPSLVRIEDTPLQGGSYSSELAAHDGPYHGEDNSGGRHESMECQDLGQSEVEQGQHQQGASDPHLLPQTYYGLS